MSPDSILLGCYIVLLGKPFSAFEELRPVETLVVIYSTTQHNIPDDLTFSNTAVRKSNLTCIHFIFLQLYLLTTPLIHIIPYTYSCQVVSSVHILKWKFNVNLSLPHLCYMLRPSHPPRCYCRRNILVKSVYIICTSSLRNFLLSLSLSLSLSLPPSYSQTFYSHPVLKHAQFHAYA